MIHKYRMRFSASAFLWTLLSILLLVVGLRILPISLFLGFFVLFVSIVVSPFSDDLVVRWTKYVFEFKFLVLVVLAIIFVFVLSENVELHIVLWGIFG